MTATAMELCGLPRVQHTVPPVSSLAEPRSKTAGRTAGNGTGTTMSSLAVF